MYSAPRSCGGLRRVRSRPSGGRPGCAAPGRHRSCQAASGGGVGVGGDRVVPQVADDEELGDDRRGARASSRGSGSAGGAARPRGTQTARSFSQAIGLGGVVDRQPGRRHRLLGSAGLVLSAAVGPGRRRPGRSARVGRRRRPSPAGRRWRGVDGCGEGGQGAGVGGDVRRRDGVAGRWSGRGRRARSSSRVAARPVRAWSTPAVV